MLKWILLFLDSNKFSGPTTAEVISSLSAIGGGGVLGIDTGVVSDRFLTECFDFCPSMSIPAAFHIHTSNRHWHSKSTAGCSTEVLGLTTQQELKRTRYLPMYTGRRFAVLYRT